MLDLKLKIVLAPMIKKTINRTRVLCSVSEALKLTPPGFMFILNLMLKLHRSESFTS